jgi:integrase
LWLRLRTSRTLGGLFDVSASGDRQQRVWELQLDHRPPYALRHTYAAFSIAAGVSLFAIARRMGTSVQQIDKTYGHLLPDAVDYERGLLDAFDAQKPSDVGVGTR